MTYTNENLADKSNAELCGILRLLGGVAPKSGKFRTKAQGIGKILELQDTRNSLENDVPVLDAEELPVEPEPTPEPTRKDRLQARLRASTDACQRRRIRKALRRITGREAKARRTQARQLKRDANGRKTRLAAEKARRAA